MYVLCDYTCVGMHVCVGCVTVLMCVCMCVYCVTVFVFVHLCVLSDCTYVCVCMCGYCVTVLVCVYAGVKHTWEGCGVGICLNDLLTF